MAAATEQQFCLKWNNHRSTLFSVFDTLLEEESLVDVTLSAEGQFLRAHRVILSACSPYFRNLFKSNFLNDKHPVVFMKDMEFENLKSLVEYMYKGEANVPQQMLTAFIKDAESLQIRGLADGANKLAEAEGLLPPRTPVQTSTPINKKSKNSNAHGSALANRGATSGGILAAQLNLAKMNASDPNNVPAGMSMFDMASFHDTLLRNPGLIPGFTPPGFPGPPHPLKKSRKSSEPRPRGGSPNKEHHISGKKPKLTSKPLPPTNNNYDDEDPGLKIDEDADPGKENMDNKMEADDIAEVDHSNGVSEEEEEPSMPGPGGELAEAATEIINPWTGGKLQLSEENDDNSAQEGVDVPVFPSPLMEQISGSLNNGRGTSGSRNATGNEGEASNKYGCARCGRSYQHQATLVRHQRYECGIQASYPCEYCNRKFKRRDVLKGHKEKCVNKVQAQAALATINATAPAGVLPGVVSSAGTSTPTGAVSPPSMADGNSSTGFHHTF